MFYYIGDESYVTLFFGAIFASVVALMLMNCIMYRSTKSMFKNIKAFAIFMAATLVFMVLVPLNATGLIGKNYSLAFTSSITLSGDGVEMKFKDDEDLEKLYNIISVDVDNGTRLRDVSFVYSEDPDEMNRLTEFFPSYTYEATYYYEKYGYYDEYGYYYDAEVSEKEISNEELVLATKEAKGSRDRYSVSTTHVSYVQKPIIGIPLAKDFSLDTNGELWQYISNSEEFVSQYDLSERIDASEIHFMEFTLFGQSTHLSGRKMIKGNAETIEKLISYCKLNPEKDENSIFVGNISIGYDITYRTYATYTENINFPVFSCDTEIINLLGELVHINYGRTDGSAVDTGKAYMSFETEEDVICYILDTANAVALVDVSTWDAKIIDSQRDKDTLIRSSSTLSERYRNGLKFVKEFDADYLLLVNINGQQISARFRDGAIDNTTLKTIFESSK
jgi:hypothetical protein